MSFLIDPINDDKIDYEQLQFDLEQSCTKLKTNRSIDSLYCSLFVRLVKVFESKQEADTDSNISLLSDWRDRFLKSSGQISIETSGSSGQRQKVAHPIQSLIRGTKLDPKHRNDIWGLTFPVDHLAGLQVLFQAILNFNPLVNLYQVPVHAVHQAIDRYRISHLSCTPTFLRLLASEPRKHMSVLRITCGGERLDQSLVQAAKTLFPHAKLTNIYATTETGTLLISHDDQFVVPPELITKVRVVDGELQLHPSLKIDAELAFCKNKNDHQVDAESVPTIEAPYSDSLREFWSTGDLVDVISEQPLTIRFVGRQHEWFNVAGYRVDPVKLETIAATHTEIAQARFYAVPNSITENLVACELVTNAQAGVLDVEVWKKWFSQQVERHEIPRFVKIVDQIATTESGKTKRTP